MYQLKKATKGEETLAMEIINQAKAYLKAQGIDQWQTGYPDLSAILGDIAAEKGYFLLENDMVFGYACIDYEGEPAYRELKGDWLSAPDAPYVVVHRMAFTKEGRGRGLADEAFRLVAEQAMAKGIFNFRVDTDADNKIMQHILKKNGFTYCGVIWFDHSEKIAFEKLLSQRGKQ